MRLIAALSVALALIGCTSRQPIRVQEGGPVYFVSPNGEPFRATAVGASPIAPWFTRTDGDHDQRITAPEFTADAARFFAEVDSNHDGQATSPEVSTLRTRTAPQLETLFPYASTMEDEANRPNTWVNQNGNLMKRQAPPPRRIVIVSLLREREPVMASDSDFNRRATRAEYDTATAQRFRLLDTDRDGALTMPELEEILERRPAR